jgi:hypothetical protein
MIWCAAELTFNFMAHAFWPFFRGDESQTRFTVFRNQTFSGLFAVGS